MPTNPKKITLARLAAHDFGRALRIWRQSSGSLNILERLVAERTRTLTSATKGLGFCVVLAFWLNTNGKALDIKVHLIDISIPSFYVNFALSLGLFGSLIGFLNYFILNEFIRVASNKLFRHDSPWALTVLFEGSSAWSSTVIPQFRFFKSRSAHRLTTIASLITMIIPIMSIILFCYLVSINNGIYAINVSGMISTVSFLIFVGWLLTLYPIIFSIVIMFPFAFDRNTNFIRWIFLFHVHRRAGLSPPRSSEWQVP